MPLRKQTKKASSSWKKINNFNMLNALIGFADGAQFDKRSPSMVKFRLLLRTTAIRDEDGNEYSQEEAADLLARALLQGRGINVYLFRNEDDTYGGNGRINIMNLDEEEGDEDEDEDKLVDKGKANGSRSSNNRTRSTKQPTKSSSRSSYKSYRRPEDSIPVDFSDEDEDVPLDEYGNPVGTLYFEGDDKDLVVVG